MTDCPEPELTNPETGTRADFSVEKIEVTKYAACNRGKFHGLRDFYRGMAK